MLVGTTAMDSKYPFPILSDMVVFPAEMVTTPVGKKSFDWLQTLEPEILSRVPQPIVPRG
jgi:branched-chain amino acid transport system substrate-binding protein